MAAFATLSLFWMKNNGTVHSYLDIDTNDLGAERWFIQFLTFWVAYSHMIPISLYVIIELLKLG